MGSCNPNPKRLKQTCWLLIQISKRERTVLIYLELFLTFSRYLDAPNLYSLSTALGPRGCCSARRDGQFVRTRPWMPHWKQVLTASSRLMLAWSTSSVSMLCREDSTKLRTFSQWENCCWLPLPLERRCVDQSLLFTSGFDSRVDRASQCLDGL